MGVQHGERGVFFGQMLEDGNQHGVLEHIGVVAGVKGVAVTEHESIVTRPAVNFI